jgi:hypothetical protein
MVVADLGLIKSPDQYRLTPGFHQQQQQQLGGDLLQAHWQDHMNSTCLIQLGSNHLDLVVATTSCCNEN